MAKRRLEKKYRVLLFVIFILICLIGLIYSLTNIINWKKDLDDLIITDVNNLSCEEFYIEINKNVINIHKNFI